MGNSCIYIPSSLIRLKRIGRFTINSMINSPDRCTFMHPFMPHEVFVFCPMSFGWYPKLFVHGLEYLGSLRSIRCRVFANEPGYLGCRFIRSIVVGRRMCYCTRIIIECVTGPYTSVSIIQSIVIGIEIAFLPVKMTNQNGPHLASISQIARPIEMPQQFICIT